MTSTIIPYDPKLKARARHLRQNMTLAEVLLWNRLKGRQLLRLDFDRQRPIDHYIVDFYCKKLVLAIEIDGRSHDFKGEQDIKRQKRLESFGVKFLRFWDIEVKQDINGVIEKIEDWVKSEVEHHE